MKIFAKEIEDGLEQKIAASASIASVSALSKCPPKYVQYFAIAGEQDDQDLYYLQSILVTSNWNKNADIFSPQEMWAAKGTPVHKPNNLSHNEKRIVGHTTACWAIDEDENILPDDIDPASLPETYHIVTGAVIYKTFQDQDYKTDVENLIAQIERGEKFVSMECIFSGFDYGMKNGDDYKVVARNENTAFLTKHLRAYGGEGKYEGYELGRILKNIRFTAYGYVDKPANENSIILKKNDYFSFAKAQKIEDFSEKGVYYIRTQADTTNGGESPTNQMENKMADENIKELKDEVKELKAALAKALEQVSKAGVEKLETANVDLTNKLTEVTKVAEAKTSEANDLSTKLTAAEKARDGYKADLDKAKAEQTKSNRISVLVEGGFDKETASTKVEKYVGLNDEQFSDIASDLIAAKTAEADAKADKAKKDKEAKDKMEDKMDKLGKAADKSDKSKKNDAEDAAKKAYQGGKANEDEDNAEAGADALDDIEVDEKDVNLNSDVNKQTNELQTSIASWFSSAVNNK